MTNVTIDLLTQAVEEIDGLSQAGFSEIASISRLALAAMENPKSCNNLDAFAHAFEAIAYKAEDIENCINATAERVGGNHVDEPQRRRWAAQRQVREGGGV